MLLIEMDMPKGSDSIGSAVRRHFACLFTPQMGVRAA